MFNEFSAAIDECIKDEQPFPQDRIKVVMYFDKSHVLCRIPTSTSKNDKTLRDVLCAAIDHLRPCLLFVIFLSTNSHLSKLAPGGPFAKSAHARQNWDALEAPITETPFDCSPSFPLSLESLTLQDTSTVEFMAQFGRPL